MQKKIVFIINSIQNPRCIKRLNEFIDKGYDVTAYAFSRGDLIFNNIQSKIILLDTYSNDLSYIKRLPILYNNIKSIVANNKDVVYYLFGLEVAMIFKIIAYTHKYIYEESDLVHTYLSNKFLRYILEKFDKYLISKSIMTVFTSEGFIKYHFGDTKPDNCIVVPNRLSPEVKQYKIKQKQPCEKLKIGFVGKIRYNSVKSFVEIFCKEYPNNEFHFFGNIGSQKEIEMFSPLNQYSNCIFHGPFKNPDDLPSIYSQINLVLSTYDVTYENVRYAEPNKLYESIYFETPIIVSKGTFLADKVDKLGIGFSIDPFDRDNIISLVDKLSLDDVKINLRCIDKDYTINNNSHLFIKLDKLFNISSNQ